METLEQLRRENSKQDVSAKSLVQIYNAEEVLQLLSDRTVIAEWKQLYSICPWATVYQSYDFVSNWYRIYKEQYTPLLITATREGKIAGLFPLCLVGAGEIMAAGLHQAEYQGWITNKSNSDSFISDALTLIRRKYPKRDIRLKYLPNNTPLSFLDKKFIKQHALLTSFRHPIMTINPEWLTAELKKKNRREKINRLKRIGELSLERVTCFTVFENIFDELAAQNDFRKGAAYNAHGLNDRSLFKNFLLSLFKANLLHVTILKVDNEIIASNVGTIGSKWLHLQGMNSHSPAFARYSPGILHFLMMGKLLAEEGFEVFDLTPGSDEYKKTLATDYLEAYELLVSGKASILQTKYLRAIRDKVKMVLMDNGLSSKRQREIQKKIKILSEKLKLGRGTGPMLLFRLFNIVKNLNKSNLWFYINIQEDINVPANLETKTNSIEDLLKYDPTGSIHTSWEFLEDSMKRLELGQHVFTISNESKLLLAVWKTSPKEKSDSNNTSAQIELENLYIHPEAFDRAKSYLERVAHHVTHYNAIDSLHLIVNTKHTNTASILEDSGFTRLDR